MPPMLTVKQTAERLSVNTVAILGFIKSKQLPAINVAKSTSGRRPRWRIKTEDLAIFEASRSTAKPKVAAKPHKLKPDDSEYPDYF